MKKFLCFIGILVLLCVLTFGVGLIIFSIMNYSVDSDSIIDASIYALLTVIKSIKL